MEDVLDVYERPYDPEIPVVCMDEKPYQLLGHERELPMQPGRDHKQRGLKLCPSRYVQHFFICGTTGRSDHVSVHEHRKAVDWAQEIKYLADEMYPDARKIVVVMDNLNTHRSASLYKAFPP